MSKTLSSLLSKLERFFVGHHDLGVTETRRRIFLGMVIMIVVPAIVILDIVNLFGYSAWELVLDGCAVLLLLTNLFLFRKKRKIVHLYRVDALMIGALLLFNMHDGGGDGLTVMWSFSFPVILFFVLGKKEAWIWVTVFGAGSLLMLFGKDLIGSFPYNSSIKVRYLVNFFIISVVSYSIESLRARFEKESRELIENLEQALNEVKTLKGLLPICSNCKKIRDDKGYWNHIEAYFKEHTEAEFTHSLCPDCIKKLYPDMADKILAKYNAQQSGMNG